MPASVARTFDLEFVNATANHPGVRPMLGEPASGPLDFAAFLSEPANFALRVEHGVFLFHRLEAGRYELHTMLLPDGHGAAVMPAFLAAARFMFTATPALEIVTKAPASNRPADLMARRAGFAPTFTRKAIWHDGGDVAFFTLTLDAWISRDDALAAEGHAFHAAIEAAKRASGSALPDHPDDDAHDRAVGAACLMAKAGNTNKALWSYNRWARFAGYEPAALVNDAPATFDIGDALITFTPDLEILKCRQQP